MAFIIVGSPVAGMYLTLLFIYLMLFANMIPYLFHLLSIKQPFIVNFIFNYLLLVITLIIIVLLVIFSMGEVIIVSEDLVMVAVGGISTMTMGGMAIALMQPPSSTINFSAIAGPINGSGLTLIATGLQRYHEERVRSRRARRRPRLY